MVISTNLEELGDEQDPNQLGYHLKNIIEEMYYDVKRHENNSILYSMENCLDGTVRKIVENSINTFNEKMTAAGKEKINPSKDVYGIISYFLAGTRNFGKAKILSGAVVKTAVEKQIKDIDINFMYNNNTEISNKFRNYWNSAINQKGSYDDGFSDAESLILI